MYLHIRLSAEGSNAYTSKRGIFVLGVAIATLLRQSDIAGLICDLWYYFAGRSYLHCAKTRLLLREAAYTTGLKRYVNVIISAL